MKELRDLKKEDIELNIAEASRVIKISLLNDTRVMLLQNFLHKNNSKFFLFNAKAENQ